MSGAEAACRLSVIASSGDPGHEHEVRGPGVIRIEGAANTRDTSPRRRSVHLGLCVGLWGVLAPPPPPPRVGPPPPPPPAYVGGPQEAANPQRRAPHEPDPSHARVTPPRREGLVVRGAPTVHEAVAAAMRSAGLDLPRARRWTTRARRSAWLPRVEVGADVDERQAWALDQQAGEAGSLGEDVGRGWGVRGRVQWDLDRVVFNPDELRAARAALDVFEARRRLASEVVKLHVAWQRAVEDLRLAAQENDPSQDPALDPVPQDPAALDPATLDALAEAAELAALLEVLTGLDYP
jgi:hypothetical protein